MSKYTYDNIDEDMYNFYIDCLRNNHDEMLSIAETSLFFMEDETFIEDAIFRYLNGEEEDA